MPRTRRTPIDQGFQTGGQDWYWDKGSAVGFGGQHYVSIDLNFSIHIPGALDDAYVNTVVLWDTGILSLGPVTQTQIDANANGVDPYTDAAGFSEGFFAFDYNGGARSTTYNFGIGQVDYTDDDPNDPDEGYSYDDAQYTAFFDFGGGQIILDESGFTILDTPSTHHAGYLISGYSVNLGGYSGFSYEESYNSYWLENYGDDGANVLIGSDFSELLAGGLGADVLTGGAGRDVFVINAVADSSQIDGSVDRITDFQTGYDQIHINGLEISSVWVQQMNGLYLLTVQTADGDITIESNNPISEADVFCDNWLNLGTPGPDALPGHAGNNRFDGGGGGDTLSGGSGTNTYLYDASSDSSAATGVDHIEYFDDGDRIVVTGVNATGLAVASTPGYGWGQPTSLTINTLSGAMIIEFGNAASFSTEEAFRNCVLVDLQVSGDGNANTLKGGGGNDGFAGGAGNDVIEGYQANDTIDGGIGNDTIDGAEGNDSLAGGDGNDLVDGGTGVETIAGGAGSDTIHGGTDTFGDTIDGGTGNDLIDSGLGADSINGGDGNDTIDGYRGNDTIDGGTGNDTATLGYQVYTISANLETGIATGYFDTIHLSNIENLIGGNYSDSLTGNASANILDGGSGNDTLDGGAGIDTMTGGDGSDDYHVRDTGDIVSETSTTGIDTVYSYLGAYTLTSNVENARIMSTGTANLTGNTLNNLFYAGIGNNTISGSTGNDTVSYLYGAIGSTGVTVSLATTAAQSTGGSGSDALIGIENLYGSNNADQLSGNNATNTLLGYAGDDTINGGGGNDTIDGGGGNNTVTAGNGNNSITVGDGNTANNGIYAGGGDNQITVSAGNGTSTVDAGNGDNIIYVSGGGINTIHVGDGNNTIHAGGDIHAGAGNDLIGGSYANDTISGGDGTDTIDGYSGNDQIFGEGGDDLLSDHYGNNTLDGGAGFDRVQVNLYYSGVTTFNFGNDTDGSVYFDNGSGWTRLKNIEGAEIIGSASDQTITGGAGDDIIEGGGGSDVIDGGDGSDRVVLDFSGYAYLDLTGNGTVSTGNGDVVSLANIEAVATGGTGNDDIIVGGTGEDIVDSNGGDDIVQGRAGNDNLRVNSGDLRGGDGNDTLTVDGARLALAGNQSSPYVLLPAFNTSIDRALSLDPCFKLATDANVTDSATTPHASIALAGNNAKMYFALTVTEANSLATIDIDSDYSAANGWFDSVVQVLDEAGNVIPGGYSDDSPIDTGSNSVRDSYVSCVISQPGIYYISIEAWSLVAIPPAARFQLNVTMNHPTVSSTLYGETGDDTLVSGYGADMLDGGGGNDTASFATTNSAVNANLLSGRATGVATDYLFGIENLRGTDYNDVLTGNTAANALDGGAGNDTLDGGAGIDSMSGGDGADFYYVREVGDAVSETNADPSSGGIDTVYSYLINYTLTANVEAARIMRTGTDSLTGNALDNLIYAAKGDNPINGGGGIDTVSYFYGLSGTTGVTVSLAIAGAQATGGSGSDTLTSIENLNGSNYADKLTGDDNANSLIGYAGNDTLDGGAGIDTMSGGDGSDVYYVRDAGDVVSETNAVAATGGTDTVFSYSSSYTLTSNVENASIISTDTSSLIGNQLDNLLYAGTGDNAITGGDGIDTLSYFFGVTGAAGVTISLANDAAQATGGSGTDTLSGIENLYGSNNADKLTGSSGANELVGYAGNDNLDGGAGIDTMSGGDGADVYYVRDVGDAVSETNALASIGGTDTVYSYLGAYTLDANVENLRILATGAADGTGNTLANLLYAGAGNNVLDGGAGIDTVSYTYATAGVTVNLASLVAQATGGSATDTLSNFENLSGSKYSDALGGNALANVIDGGAGSDTLIGGDGSDSYYVDNAADLVTETNASVATGGTDTVYSYLANYTLGANVENLRILATGTASGTGNALANVLYAGAGNNVLDGSAGIDTVSYAYATAGVTVSLANALAQATGGSGSDTLIGIERLIGSNFNDTLGGTTGNNNLSGGAGADTLQGGTGNDNLIGGTGADAFLFNTALSATTNKDTITDFIAGSDKIRLDDDIFTGLTAGVAMTTDQFYAAAGASAAHDASDRIIYNTSTGALYYDADGNAAGSSAVQFAVLTTHPALTVSDFVIVA